MHSESSSKCFSPHNGSASIKRQISALINWHKHNDNANAEYINSARHKRLPGLYCCSKHTTSHQIHREGPSGYYCINRLNTKRSLKVYPEWYNIYVVAVTSKLYINTYDRIALQYHYKLYLDNLYLVHIFRSHQSVIFMLTRSDSVQHSLKVDD